MMKYANRSDAGQSFTELAILLGLVAAVVVVGLTRTGEGTRDALCRASSAFGGKCGDLLRDDFFPTLTTGQFKMAAGRYAMAASASMAPEGSTVRWIGMTT